MTSPIVPFHMSETRLSRKVFGCSLSCQSFHCVQFAESQYWHSVRGCHVEVANLKCEQNTSKEPPLRKFVYKTSLWSPPKMQTGLSGIKRNIWERKTPLDMFPYQFQISKILTNKILKFKKKFQTRKVGTLQGPINLLVVTNKHLPRSFKVTASCLIVGEGGREALNCKKKWGNHFYVISN